MYRYGCIYSCIELIMFTNKVKIIFIYSDDCCCELCKDISCHNNELTDKLNEISKVSSPIQES